MQRNKILSNGTKIPLSNKNNVICACPLVCISKWWIGRGYLYSWPEYFHFKTKQKPLPSKLINKLTKFTISNSKEGNGYSRIRAKIFENVKFLGVIFFQILVTETKIFFVGLTYCDFGHNLYTFWCQRFLFGLEMTVFGWGIQITLTNSTF